MRLKWKILLLVVCFAGFASMGWGMQAPREAPLSNEAVVKLCSLDLGDDVVIAKINQAKLVEFRLDTDNLLTLKKAGVSKDVIAAMLKRATGPQGGPGVAPVMNPLLGSNNNMAGEDGVSLRLEGDKVVRLQSVQGDISRTWAYVVTLTFLDFPGLKAEARITDHRPILLVRTSKNPRGRMFLVKCKPNQGDNNRSVKVGKAGIFTQKSWASPDGDWTIEYTAKEISENLWELRSKTDLEPGEYGLLFRGGFLGNITGEGADLFDFGVD